MLKQLVLNKKNITGLLFGTYFGVLSAVAKNTGFYNQIPLAGTRTNAVIWSVGWSLISDFRHKKDYPRDLCTTVIASMVSYSITDIIFNYYTRK